MHIPFSRLFLAGLLVLSCFQMACTPVLDWREVHFDLPAPTHATPKLVTSAGRQLNAVLPCKPDRATREQTLAGQRVQLSMMGCKAGDTTFTLSRMVLIDAAAETQAAQVAQILAAWQQASLAGVADSLQPIAIAGASAWPPAVRTSRAAARQIVWFAQNTTGALAPLPIMPQGATPAVSQLVLYQAAVYPPQQAQPHRPEELNIFFDSLNIN